MLTSYEKVKIALRFDVSPHVGMGHYKRAETLSAELTRKNIDHLFVVTNESRSHLDALNPQVPVATADDRNGWVKRTQITHVITDICRDGNFDQANAEIGDLTSLDIKVVVIDSMPPDNFVSQIKPAPNLVITPYLDANKYMPKPKTDRWLFGAEWAILDPSYSQIKPHSDFPKKPTVLISCGGSDPENLTEKILSLLCHSNLEIDVVVGALFDGRHKFRLQSYETSPSIRFYKNPNGLAKLIAKASVVVGRVGLLRYEAASLARNGIYLSEGTAYQDYLRGFAAKGLAKIFFTSEHQGEEQFFTEIKELTNLQKSVAVMSKNAIAEETVNGRGAENVIKAIFDL